MTPKLSIIVIIYKMPYQAYNTLISLTQSQKNVSPDDYEIVAIENKSDAMLDERAVLAISPNIKYFLREEAGKSPAPAINFGLGKASGAAIGLLIDGARMVTPRVIEYSLMALTASPNALVCVPGYYIGPYEHKDPASTNFSAEEERHLLEVIQWKKNPYRLFDQCQISSANTRGVFQPFLESNCFFTSKHNMHLIGGADERFNLPGGGSINMYMLKAIGTLPSCSHIFILQGEGTFHQQHGGVSTSKQEDREKIIEAFSQQLREISNKKHFRSFYREPVLFGSSTSHSMKFLRYSSERAIIRFNRLTQKGEDFWPDDNLYQRDTEHHS